MELSQLLDALSVSFFALLGLWAGAARGHWFFRAAAVSSFLLIALLIPAYEPVVEFGLQMAIIAMVVSVVRGRAPWRSRWSLETVLLLTVVLAVVFAVIGSMPSFTAAQWLGMLGIGVVTALFALLCLWIVFGRVRPRWRLLFGLLGIALLLITLHFGTALQTALNNLNMRMSWQEIVLSHYDAEYMPTWFVWNGMTTAAALLVVVSALCLARATGWFSAPQNAANEAAPRALPLRMRFARMGVCTIIAGIGLPLLYVLYRLATPPPFPAIALPSPNGYDDFIAAGNLMPEEFQLPWDLSSAQLSELANRVTPTIHGIELGLTKECRMPNPFADPTDKQYEEEMSALHDCSWALTIRTTWFERNGQWDEFVDAALQDLHFSQECIRGGGTNYWDFFSEGPAVGQLSNNLDLFNSRICRRIAREVSRFDRNREPYANRQAVQAIIDQHSDWQTRLNHLLTVWSGTEPNAMDELQQREIAETRLLIADAALQAYTLEHGRPPDTLYELVPEYLEQIPIDPFSSTSIRYLCDGPRYTVYSVGMDRADDQGSPENQAFNGDIALTGPHLRPLWTQLGDAATAAWQKVRSLMPVLREGEAPAEP